MKLFKYSLYLSFLLCTLSAAAQGENNNWHFGRGRYISFSTLTPTYGINSNMRTGESSAAVSDAQGNLLFYTIGSRIWDRNGTEMPGATGLLGNGPTGTNGFPVGSAAFGVQVIKNPGNPNQYYIFVLDPIEVIAPRKLYYNLVDMTLNNGLGDVVAGMSNIVLLQGDIPELLFSTLGGDCNTYWLMVRPVIGNSTPYYAYKIDAGGVQTTPVISNAAPEDQQPYVPYVIANKSGSVFYAKGTQNIVRYRFDNLTGVVSNPELIPCAKTGLMLCLSPDESKLYLSSGNTLQQLDLSLYPNLGAISNSISSVGNPSNPLDRYTDLKIGPDQKLYTPKVLTSPTTGWMSTRVDRIEFPNLAGTAAGYTSSVFPEDTTVYGYFGSHIVVENRLQPVIKNTIDTQFCSDKTNILYASEPGAVSHLWNTGATGSSLRVSNSGTYWVRNAYNCAVFIDTFKVTIIDNTIDLGKDTTICEGRELLLDINDPGRDSYMWSDGSRGPRLVVSGPGQYYVTATKKGCVNSDTIMVQQVNPYVAIKEPDATICNDAEFELHASSNMESTFSWNKGGNTAVIRPQETGWYTVSAQNACGVQKDSVHITVKDCICDLMVPNAFTPNNDGLNDRFVPKFMNGCEFTFYELYIFNRYGQIIFYTADAQQGWDGMQNGAYTDAGVYMYLLKYQDANKPRKVNTYSGDVLLVR